MYINTHPLKYTPFCISTNNISYQIYNASSHKIRRPFIVFVAQIASYFHGLFLDPTVGRVQRKSGQQGIAQSYVY
jgi:hypothetical protein